MASDYPADFDDLAMPVASDTLDDPEVQHDLQHVNANQAVMAVQQALGKDPQGEYASVRQRLDRMQRPATTIYQADEPVDEDVPGGLRPGDLWTESDVDAEEFDLLSFEERLEALEAGELAGLVNEITGGGTLTDDDDYYYLTFNTAGIYIVDLTLDSGSYADVYACAWGAGGGGNNTNGSRKGGGGGFVEGAIAMRPGAYCIVVGDGGLSRGSNAGLGAVPWLTGRGGSCGTSGFGGWGGGLSGVFERSTPWTGGRPLLVAGGGGGAGHNSNGGVGGGWAGGTSSDGNATGGTQTAPGQAPSAGLIGSIFADAYQGGSSFGNTDGGGGGGGGGGYYGGGNGANNTSDGGGGGGSSYADPNDVSSPTTEAGSAEVPGGTSNALYPGSSVAYGGVGQNPGIHGHVVLRWAKAA